MAITQEKFIMTKEMTLSDAKTSSELIARLNQKEQQLHTANVKITQLESQLSFVYGSLSWRITSPLRKLGLKLPQLLNLIARLFGDQATPQLLSTHRMVRGQPLAAIKEVERVNGSIAIQLHLYYTDLLEEIAAYLTNVPFEFSLFVSISDGNQKEVIQKRLKSIKSVKTCSVKIVPNRGRDVAPLVSVFADDLLRHEFICHIHSKKTLYIGEPQNGWRKHLFDNMMGSASTVRKIFGIFETNEDIGIIYPETYPASDYWAHTWLNNKQLGQHICRRLGVDCDFSGYVDCPMDTMFWARAKAIAPLLSAGLTIDDFPEEAGQIDGTLAHTIEKMLVPLVLSQGFTFCEINTSRKEMSFSFGSWPYCFSTASKT